MHEFMTVSEHLLFQIDAKTRAENAIDFMPVSDHVPFQICIFKAMGCASRRPKLAEKTAFVKLIEHLQILISFLKVANLKPGFSKLLHNLL